MPQVVKTKILDSGAPDRCVPRLGGVDREHVGSVRSRAVSSAQTAAVSGMPRTVLFFAAHGFASITRISFTASVKSRVSSIK